MRVGSLFTGIGGLDLGLTRAGFEIAWQVEIDEYCRKVLAQHWPGVKRYEDVRGVGAHNLIWADILVGGFPCQDISSAGKRAGIEGERSGLWKEFARIIKEIRPRYVLIENVAALLHGGKTCNGERREAAIATVLRDLAERGYDAEWRVFSAAEFGAPHLRRRVFIVAYDPGQRRRAWRAESAGQQGQANADRTGTPELANADSDGRGQWAHQQEPGRECAAEAHAGEEGTRELAHTNRARLEIRDRSGPGAHEDRAAIDEHRAGPLESGVGGVFNGFSAGLDGIEQRWPAGPGEEQFEWEPERVIEGKLENRVARLKGLGNSALPQIAEAIGYAIRRFDQARLWAE